MSLLRALWDSINTGTTWKIEKLKDEPKTKPHPSERFYELQF